MLGVGIVGVYWEVLALVLDFREVMLTSPPELAYCAPPPYSSGTSWHVVFCVVIGGVTTGFGFQRSYADLTP